MIYNLQVLRGLAAMLVVTAHFGEVLNGVADRRWAWPGLAGVDVFFVISGFVMVYTTARRPVSAQDFLANRIIRVVPLYWLTTLLIAAYFALRTNAHRTMTPGLVATSLLFIPARDYTGFFYPVLFVGWTLNYEMVFYLLFAVGLAATRRRVGLVAAVLSALLAIVALIGASSSSGRVTLFGFYTSSIIVEFGYGMLLGLVFLGGRAMPRIVAAALLVVGAPLLIGSTLVMTEADRGVLLGLPALAIVAGSLYLERDGLAARNKLAQLIGASSYALYLVHPFVLLGANKVAGKISGPVARIGLAGLTMVMAVLVAIILHVLVERPLTDWLRRRLAHRPMATDQADPSVTLERSPQVAMARTHDQI